MNETHIAKLEAKAAARKVLTDRALLDLRQRIDTFGSNGALFVAPYQLQPGPDPTQPA